MRRDRAFLKTSGKYVLLVLLPLIYSCSFATYPSQWSPMIPIQNQKCPNLSGVYWNDGIGSDGGNTHFYYDKTYPVTHFQLIHDDEFLKILFFRDDKLVDVGSMYTACIVPKNVLRKSQCSCGDSGISIPTRPVIATEFSKGMVPLSGGLMGAKITKTIEGDLIAKVNATGIAFVVFIPVPFSITEYVRFIERQ